MMKEEPFWPEQEEPPIRKEGTRRFSARRLGKRIVWCAAVVAALPFVLTILYIFIPPVSTLMVANALTGNPLNRQWVNLESVNPAVIRAVVASEDSRFCGHSGVDWHEMRRVLGNAAGPNRGASTLTMQTAKNLFLWHDFPHLRKPLEIVLAYWLELVLSKERIVEIYLNIAEWGPDGTFGIEAGAQKAFRRPAAQLTTRQATLMAVALPNPLMRNPAKPKAFHSTLAMRLQQRMRATDISCIRG